MNETATPSASQTDAAPARARAKVGAARGHVVVRATGAVDGRVAVLSRELFLRHLHMEKRRSDRTGSPLALIVASPDEYRADGSVSSDAVIPDAVIEVFAASKRETDLLGFTDDLQIGVLLPHTALQGAEAYLGSISRQLECLPVHVQAAEYPDNLFEAVLNESAPRSAPLEYIAAAPARHGSVANVLKRALDIIGATAGVLVLSPIMLATALAVAVSSPGPVIFRQSRLGKGGKPFTLFKFRSMRTGSDDAAHRKYVASLIEGRHDEINQGDAEKPIYKMTVDPRVTRVGRVIRRTSIDELPQLFNVLRGDMSLVGPRPPLPYEAERYQPWHLRRILEVQPGVTGLWQVEGRSTTSFDDMVRLDLRYAQTRSFWLDLKIILRTVFVLFGTHGAT